MLGGEVLGLVEGLFNRRQYFGNPDFYFSDYFIIGMDFTIRHLKFSVVWLMVLLSFV